MTKTRYPSEIFSAGIRIDKPILPEFQVCDRCEKINGDYRSPAPTPIATQEDQRIWQEYLSRWKLRYPVKLTLSAELDWQSHLRIVFRYEDEPDSREDTNQQIQTTGGLLVPSPRPDENTPRWIRTNIQYHLGHELDEHLRFDGDRVFDPHVDATYICESCVNIDDHHGVGDM